MNKYLISTSILVLLLAAFGCGGGQSIMPDPSHEDGLISVSENSNETMPSFLGLYQVNIDTTNMTGSLEPIRSSAAVDVLEAVDITGFLSSSPCQDCIKIFNIGLDADWNLELNIGIKHPFDVGNPSLPISGRNRADIHVFNVEGIVVSDSPELIRFESNLMDVATGNLMNPDGYTHYLDTLLDNVIPTTSDMHPYILHFDDYSNGNFDEATGFEDVLNPSGNLVMKMGSDYSIKKYVFDVPPGEPVSFGFAVGCTFGFSTDSYLDRFTPEYRLPQFNKKAASEVQVTVVSNDLERGDLTSEAVLRIEVMDINHDIPAGSKINEMLFDSSVAQISIEAPDICDEIYISDPIALSGDGRTSPLVYEVTVINDQNGEVGNNPCLIRIKDSYPIRGNPNYALLKADIMGRDEDMNMVLDYVFEIATYQYIDLYVEPCEGMEIKPGALDIGVDALGSAYVAYSNKEIWKYDSDYCTGSAFITVDYEVAGELRRMDVSWNGNCITYSSATNC